LHQALADHLKIENARKPAGYYDPGTGSVQSAEVLQRVYATLSYRVGLDHRTVKTQL
jgi:hypothetical protein